MKKILENNFAYLQHIQNNLSINALKSAVI